MDGLVRRNLLHRCAVRGAQRLRAACGTHRGAANRSRGASSRTPTGSSAEREKRTAERRNRHAKRERDARDAGPGRSPVRRLCLSIPRRIG